MGSGHGQAGGPWLSAGFYDPAADPFRSDSEFDPANTPVDPPRNLEREVQPGAPVTAMQDAGCVAQPDFPSFDGAIEPLHGSGHGHIGGGIGARPPSFPDPLTPLLPFTPTPPFAPGQPQTPH